MPEDEVRTKRPIKAGSWFYLINYGVLAALVFMFVSLSDHGIISGGNFAAYYVDALHSSLRSGFFWIIAAVTICLLAMLVLSFFWHAWKQYEPSIFLKKIFSKNGLKFILSGIKNFIFFACPALASYLIFGLSLGAINKSNALRLKDALILSWDKFITGTYPFITLGNIHYPEWFLGSVKWSFDILPIMLTVFAFYLALTNIKLLKEYSTAFSVVLLIMLPIWLLFPALSPQDRYIRNIYDLPISPEMQAQLSSYHPQQGILDFFAFMVDSKKGLGGIVPTTTMPSAHVAWATLLVVYAFRDRKFLGWFISIIAGLSTIGTVLLAQHYFVDMPTGIMFAVAAAALAKFSLL